MRSSFFSVVFFTSLLFASDGCIAHKLGFRKLKSVEDVEAFFPKTIEEIEERKTSLILGIKEVVEEICRQEPTTFDNTARLFDLLFGSFIYGRENPVGYVYPDKEMRLAAEKASTEIAKAYFLELNSHPKLYTAICSIPLDGLTKEQEYFVNEVKNELKRMGLNLSQEKRDRVQVLQEEIADLCENFGRNIRESRKSFFVTLEELKGMDENFINSLTKKEDLYELTTDYPIVKPVLSYCSVESTRKKMYETFNRRAVGANEEILQSLSLKRNLLAQLLGYSSYAAMQLQPEMVKTPENAKEFLESVEAILKDKQLEDFAFLKEHKPKEITLTEDVKFNPWDMGYVLTQVRIKKYDVDTEALKVFFPLDYSLKGLIEIYEKFFSICIEEVPSSLWHEDVRLVRVSNKEKDIIYGYITLDLFPREGKYTHACDMPLLPSLKTDRGEYPALSAVVCNFPAPTKELPSLLRLSDLGTFFHEFGHALHDMLGRTDLVSTAGTNTKYDFVEMPSQILEEWLNDPTILQMCSSHYETGEKLSLDIIGKMISYKKSFQANLFMSQLVYANFSLSFHQSPQQDLKGLWADIKNQYCIETKPMPNDCYYLAFGHLREYGARYYGYLWSKVFALDVFERIKKEGLLNPNIGEEYIRYIIGRGGSMNPNQYLLDFLGREPNIEAFSQSIR